MAKHKTAQGLVEIHEVLHRGVYQNAHRNSAIVVKAVAGSVWFLTMQDGHIECVHWGNEKFKKEYCIALANYPIRRALRLYDTSGVTCDEQAKKVLARMLANT